MQAPPVDLLAGREVAFFCAGAGSVRFAPSKCSLRSDRRRTFDQAASRMAITVAVRRRKWSLRLLAETC